MLPHFSHRIGRAADLALFYDGRAAGGAWPVGYFAFAPVGDLANDPCRQAGAMRWNMAALQTFFASLKLDREKTRTLVNTVAAHPSVTRAFLEPALTRALGVSDAKIRFAGCHAARHDDHIHIEVAPGEPTPER